MSTETAPTAAELAALLSSRVCHDIAGPTSAMGAALSVLDDESALDMRDDAIAHFCVRPVRFIPRAGAGTADACGASEARDLGSY